jgi:glutaredoxin
MDPQEIYYMLNSKKFIKDVRQELQYAKTKFSGTCGVPYITLNGQKVGAGCGAIKNLYEMLLNENI